MNVKILLVTAVMFFITGLSYAEEGMENSKAAVMEQTENTQAASTTNSSEAKTEEATKPVEIGNKICPVSGEKVGQMGEIVQVEYKGKMYNLCCSMCLKDFNKDPETFSKKAEEIAEQEKMETEASESNTPTKSE